MSNASKKADETKADEIKETAAAAPTTTNPSEVELLKKQLAEEREALAAARQEKAMAEEALRTAGFGSDGKRPNADLTTTTTKPVWPFDVVCRTKPDLGTQRFNVVDEGEAVRLFTIANKLDVSSHHFTVTCADPNRAKKIETAIVANEQRRLRALGLDTQPTAALPAPPQE